MAAQSLGKRRTAVDVVCRFESCSDRHIVAGRHAAGLISRARESATDQEDGVVARLIISHIFVTLLCLLFVVLVVII